MIRLFIKLLLFLVLFVSTSTVFSQSLDGLKDIVSFQQEKISQIEDNLKKLIGSVEEQSNNKIKNNSIKSIESQINDINEKLRLLDNSIKNITNLSFNLEFALKRIERHLELSSIQNNNLKDVKQKKSENVPVYKNKEKINVNKKSLDGKTQGVLGFVKEEPENKSENKKQVINTEKKETKNETFLPEGSAEDNYNYALDLARQLDFNNAEKAFKEFLIVHKDSKKRADAQYWLGRMYFAQKKYEEAAIALAEFNSIFPSDPRFQETTLLIAESAVNFAPKDQLCDILNQSLEFMINPSERFVKRIKSLKYEKQCPSE